MPRIAPIATSPDSEHRDTPRKTQRKTPINKATAKFPGIFGEQGYHQKNSGSVPGWETEFVRRSDQITDTQLFEWTNAFDIVFDEVINQAFN
ncbi:MAG: hypothetical protein R3C26_03835 [Calditrichia bacterium]